MSSQQSHERDPYEEVLVSPRYLAGMGASADASFAPVAHWPHHDLGDTPCQLLVTSPDHRIRIGWYGDDWETWKITASQDATSAPRWTATFNHLTAPEIVAGLTTALAHDYAEADAYAGNGRFLDRPSIYWADAVQPLTDAGWRRKAGERGTVEIVAPDGQAGALIDNRLSGRDDENITLWSGPPGWGTRAEAYFTAGAPSHLIAATTAAMTISAPVVRERHQLNQDLEHLVTLASLSPAAPRAVSAPTPLDVRRTAVVQAVHRAAHAPRTAADLRVVAAQSRTTSTARNRSSNLTPAAAAVTPPASSAAPRHHR
ncbi:DUF317 domain-containing protein [Streptomyces sp. NPDC050422]|uniref:DUF317 domain-containing protein n=1 Tax=Streptomyces sp. NPDC050422 TaxID=3365614 RepID=UPI0037896B28